MIHLPKKRFSLNLEKPEEVMIVGQAVSTYLWYLKTKSSQDHPHSFGASNSFLRETSLIQDLRFAIQKNIPVRTFISFF